MNDKKPKYFKKDLRRVEGSGDFPCPECGITISPEGASEGVYSFVDTKTRKEELVSMTIQHDCGAYIKLTGFSAKPLEKHQEIIV